MKDNTIGNPQERNLFEFGWLIGAIEGEGCIGITIRTRKTENVKPTFKPHVQISNCDYAFIERCCKALDALDVPYYVSHHDGKGNRRNHWNIIVAGLKRVRKILPTIIPFLCGEKLEKAELTLKFIESRLERSKFKPYTIDEIKWYEKLASLNMKGKKATILNDYTRGASN